MDALVFKMNLCMYIMTSHYNKTFFFFNLGKIREKIRENALLATSTYRPFCYVNSKQNSAGITKNQTIDYLESILLNSKYKS